MQFLLLPFWSRGTQRATLKDLPPTQRCIDSVYSGVRVRPEALQLSSIYKKKDMRHPGGRAGFHCKDCDCCGVALADCCCGNRGVEATFADCRCGSRAVAASLSHTAVAAAETLRRHTLRLLLRQLRRCGVTLADCCCGSGDVTASHSHTAVAAAGTLRRRTRTLLLRQQASHQLLRRSQRRACSTDSRGVPEVASVSRKPRGFRMMPWWSAKPPLFQRGGCLRRVIALHIGVDWITRLCQPSVSGAIVLRGGARSGCCRAARSGRQAAWRLGLSS